MYGVDGRGEGGITDPLLADIHTEFNQCLNSFQKNTKVRLILLHVPIKIFAKCFYLLVLLRLRLNDQG